MRVEFEYCVTLVFCELEESGAVFLLGCSISYFFVGSDYLVLKVEIRVVAGVSIFLKLDDMVFALLDNEMAQFFAQCVVYGRGFVIKGELAVCHKVKGDDLVFVDILQLLLLVRV